MKELSVYVYWEGDGYNTTVAVSDETYKILMRHPDEHILSNFKHPEIHDECLRIYEDLK